MPSPQLHALLLHRFHYPTASAVAVAFQAEAVQYRRGRASHIAARATLAILALDSYLPGSADPSSSSRRSYSAQAGPCVPAYPQA